MAIKICLDAGHFGKYNRSPVVPEYYESDMNWKLHLMLKAELEKYGIEVITTRSNKDKDMGLQARGNASKGCNLFISIHSNGAERESADYPVVYRPISGACADLALKIAQFVEKTMETTEKGRAESRKGSGNWDYYGVIYGSVAVGVPGLIFEHSFHTNTKSAQWLMDDSNLAKLAVGEADIIATYFGLQKPAEKPTEEPKKEPEEELEHYYRIRRSWDEPATQTGAYKSLENAKRACPDGYAVYDWHGNAVYERYGEFEAETYPLEQFIKDVQAACGAAVDGIVGPETIGKTVTLSSNKNRTHPAVKPVQKRLYALGYTVVGEADGIAGNKFTLAVREFQKDNRCWVDGEITAANKTWKVLLGVS